MSEETKKCPYCAEIIKAESVVCNHCGHDLSSFNNGSEPQLVSPSAPPIPGSNLAKHIANLVNKLQSPKSSSRYEACEHLRVSPSITLEAIEALKIALKDSDKEVSDAAVRALQAHETPQNLPDQTPHTAASPDTPAAASLGLRVSLAILGVATTGIVSSIIFGLWTPGIWGPPDWRLYLLAWIYPLAAPQFLLLGFVYVVPCIIAFKVPAWMNPVDAGARVVLSGCVAGLVYEMGLFLAVVYGSGM
jgi:hypothetical protein